MADVLVTLPDGSQAVVDSTLLRPPPAQEPPLGSYVRVAVAGADEIWWRRTAGWSPVDDATNVQAWAFLTARDLTAHPALLYRGGGRLAEALASQVQVDAGRITTIGLNKIRVQPSGTVVAVAFNASADTLAPAAAVALGMLFIRVGMELSP